MNRIRTVAVWLHRRAEDILAAMLFVMFAAFLLQVGLRYLTTFPIGWTNELSAILWVWMVLWGAAFVLREHEEIRFDLISGAVPDLARRAMVLVSAVALVVLYIAALPDMADYILFMKVQKSAYLKIRFDYLFIVYLLFAVAVIARYLHLSWRALRGDAPKGSGGERTAGI